MVPPQDPAAFGYAVKVVGALPLLVGLLRRMGIARRIDQICPADAQSLVSHGDATEVLVANRWAAPRPLYSVQAWAEAAGVAHVLGVDPARLNDDRLGRTLEVLAHHAPELKGEIALALAEEFGIGLKQTHYDLTTVYVEGAYEEEDPGALRILYTRDNCHEPVGKGFRGGGGRPSRTGKAPSASPTRRWTATPIRRRRP